MYSTEVIVPEICCTEVIVPDWLTEICCTEVIVPNWL